MIKCVILVGRSSFDVDALRKIFKAAKNVDLSTSTKGRLESIAVLSKMICRDEYNYVVSTKLITYSFIIFADPWLTPSIFSVFDRATFHVEETLNRDLNLFLVTARLSDFVEVIKTHSTQDTPMLRIFNELQKCLEDDGFVQLFKGCNKHQVGTNYYLTQG